MRIKYSLILLVVLLYCMACESNKAKPGITLIPCQVQDSLWGFADVNGNIVIKPQFKSEPSYFRDGYAIIVKKDGKFDYIDENGKLMNKNYFAITPFSEGLAVTVEENSYPVVVDKNFNKVFEMKSAQEIGIFSEGLARFRNYKQMWGFLDKAGKIAIKPIYDYAESFSEGLALIEAKDTGLVPFKAFIDKEGNIIAKYDYEKYSKIRNFSDGMSAFFEGSGWGFFDNKGKVAIKSDSGWIEVTDFKNGYASVLKNDKWGLIDKSGEMILKAEYIYPVTIHSDLGAVMVNNKVGFIGIDGKDVIKPQFDDLVLPFISENGIVKSGSEFIFIDKNGKPTGNAKMKNVGRNFYFVTDLYYSAKNDFFAMDKILSLVGSELSQSSLNGFKYGDEFDKVVEKAGLTGQLTFNPYDSTHVISKPGKIDNFFNYTLNYKFKSVGNKYKLVTIVFSADLMLGYSEKSETIKKIFMDKLSKAGFTKRSEERTIVYDGSASIATIEAMGPRFVFRFDFRSL
jgi:hypothetical protein